MPNWVKNILTVYGDENEFSKMMDDIKSEDSQLAFHAIWNTCEATVNDDGNLEFDTAWSAPEKAVTELAAKYPELSFIYKWADEDHGANTGHIEYEDGMIAFEYYPDKFSKDDYEIYAYCWKTNPDANDEEE